MSCGRRELLWFELRGDLDELLNPSSSTIYTKSGWSPYDITRRDLEEGGANDGGVASSSVGRDHRRRSRLTRIAPSVRASH